MLTNVLNVLQFNIGDSYSFKSTLMVFFDSTLIVLAEMCSPI
jgi:hypothetical protein